MRFRGAAFWTRKNLINHHNQFLKHHPNARAFHHTRIVCPVFLILIRFFIYFIKTAFFLNFHAHFWIFIFLNFLNFFEILFFIFSKNCSFFYSLLFTKTALFKKNFAILLHCLIKTRIPRQCYKLKSLFFFFPKDSPTHLQSSTWWQTINRVSPEIQMIIHNFYCHCRSDDPLNSIKICFVIESVKFSHFPHLMIFHFRVSNEYPLIPYFWS